MINIFLIIFLELIFVALLSFIIYKIINKQIYKLIEKSEIRIRYLSQSIDGKRILEDENYARLNKQKKIYPVVIFLCFLSYVILLCVGISGVYLFIKELIDGKNFMQIIYNYKGYYLISPFLIIYTVYNIIYQIQVLLKIKK